MAISSAGLDFVVRHEGFVSTAYRDQGGVWTIGTGFTNRSATAAKLLGRIGRGKTITRARNDQVLRSAFANEYGPPVDRAMPGGVQHELDAGYSYSFNAGPAAMGDVWVSMWRAGRKTEAGERLKVTRVTARGKPSRGLRNRRVAEARLLTTGDYGSGVPEPPASYHAKLRDLGYTSVLAFQRNHPNLVNDGIMGPATRAQIDRDIAARKEGVGVAVGVGIAAFLAQYGPFIALVGVAVLVGFFVLRRREEVTHWIRNRFD